MQNNVKNASTGYRSLELNYGYYSKVSYEKDIDLHSQLRSIDKVAISLHKPMSVCRENF